MGGLPPRSTVSPFVARWLPHVARALGVPGARRAALDLAMGEGRHALALAAAGFTTFGVDRSIDRLRTGQAAARGLGVALRLWVSDLERDPLPRDRFDLLLCTRFLLRHRWPEVRAMVRPGGFVIYETFTTGQAQRSVGPTSPDHLLEPGELRRAFAAWTIVASEEVDEPAAMARLVARNPG